MDFDISLAATRLASLALPCFYEGMEESEQRLKLSHLLDMDFPLMVCVACQLLLESFPCCLFLLLIALCRFAVLGPSSNTSRRIG